MISTIIGTIGICAPASPPAQESGAQEIVQRISALGVRVVKSPHLTARTGYLAGSDEERAGDLHGLFLNPEVDGIFALRGGFGSCRMLELLDYGLIAANPKPLLGFSDITALLNGIHAKSGIVTLHGPNAGQAFNPPESAPSASLLRILKSRPKLHAPGLELLGEGSPFPADSMETWTPGTVKGKLLGGNFTCFERLLGTPYMPDCRGAILFLEDVNEKAYRVDGLFTHFRLAGVLKQVAGLILGRFSHPEPEEEARIQETLRREVARLGVPCIAGAPIGHELPQMTIPVGHLVVMDATARNLALA